MEWAQTFKIATGSRELNRLANKFDNVSLGFYFFDLAIHGVIVARVYVAKRDKCVGPAVTVGTAGLRMVSDARTLAPLPWPLDSWRRG